MSVRAHTSRRLRLAAILTIAVAAIAATVPTVTADSIATGHGAEALAARAAVAPEGTAVGTRAPAATGGAVATAASAGPMLGGFTSQGWPAVIQLSADRRHLAKAEIGLTLNCTSGGELDLPVGDSQVPVGATGAFHDAGTIPAQPGNPVSLTGGSESFSGVLHRASSTLSGTWRLRLNFKASDGTTDHCDSGAVHLSVRL